eukprot:gene3822-6332_t
MYVEPSQHSTNNQASTDLEQNTGDNQQHKLPEDRHLLLEFIRAKHGRSHVSKSSYVLETDLKEKRVVRSDSREVINSRIPTLISTNRDKVADKIDGASESCQINVIPGASAADRDKSPNSHTNHRSDALADESHVLADKFHVEKDKPQSLQPQQFSLSSLAVETVEWRLDIRALVLRKHLLLRRYWTIWKMHRPPQRTFLSRVAIADTFHDIHVLKTAFTCWKGMRAVLRKQLSLVRAADAFTDSMLMHRTLHLWRKSLLLYKSYLKQYTAATQKDNHSQLRRSFCRYRKMLMRKRGFSHAFNKAYINGLKHVLKRAMLRWQERMAHISCMNTEAFRFQSTHILKFSHACLYLWCERTKQKIIFQSYTLQFQRDQKHRNLKQHFRKWHRIYHKHHRLHTCKQYAIENIWRPRMMMRVFEYICEQGLKWHQNKIAQCHYKTKLATNGIAIWRAALESREMTALHRLILNALHYHQQSVITQAWIKWTKALLTKRRLVMLATIGERYHRSHMMANFLQKWQVNTGTHKRVSHLCHTAIKFRIGWISYMAWKRLRMCWHVRVKVRYVLPTAIHADEVRCLRTAIHRWQQFWLCERSRKIQLAKAEDLHFHFRLRRYWQCWRRRKVLRRRLADLGSLACLHYDQQLLRKAWASWQQQIFQYTELESLGNFFLQKRSSLLVKEYMFSWRRVLAFQRWYSEACSLASSLRKHRLLELNCSRWRRMYQCTQIVRQTSASRLRSLAWKKIRNVFKARTEMHTHHETLCTLFESQRRQKCLCTVWSDWRYAYQRHQSLRNKWQLSVCYHNQHLQRKCLAALVTFVVHRRKLHLLADW